MKKAVVGVLIVLALGAWNFTRMERPVWQDACRLTEEIYSCKGLKPPTIVTEEFTEEGLRGWYGGDDVIHISKKLKGWDRKSTIFHETVHYLQVKAGGKALPAPAFYVCQMEDEAFMITDIYVREVLGHKDYNRWDTWWESYPYCWPWYNKEAGMGTVVGQPFITIY